MVQVRGMFITFTIRLMTLYKEAKQKGVTMLDHDDSKAFRFVAIRAIQPEEEICINYGGIGYWNDGRKDIKLVD